MTSQAQSSYSVANPMDDNRDSGEPMTEKQAVKLRELAEAAGEPFDGNLTEAQAARRIAYFEEMQDT